MEADRELDREARQGGISPLRLFLGIVAYLVALPVLLCAVFKLLPLGPLGAWAYLKYFVDMLLVPVLLFWLYCRVLTRSGFGKRLKLGGQLGFTALGLVGSFVGGYVLATLSFNMFASLTYLLGISGNMTMM